MTVISVERRGHIAVMTFNRPETLNALGRLGDGDEIRAACEATNADPEVRCVILTGAGKAFSAGGNLNAMKARTEAFAGGGTALRDSYRRNIQRIAKAFHELDVPTIAAVNGAAIGLGCDIACLADIRMAADDAVFGATFLKLGLIPGDGGAWLLPRIIGMSRACELLFTGKTIDAATAARWGLVSQVVPASRLLDDAMAMANQIAAQPPHALRLTKALLREGQATSYHTLMEMSAASQALAHLTEDHMEGLEAFMERRLPAFKGR